MTAAKKKPLCMFLLLSTSPVLLSHRVHRGTSSSAQSDCIHDTLTHIENMTGPNACHLTQLEQLLVCSTITTWSLIQRCLARCLLWLVVAHLAQKHVTAAFSAWIQPQDFIPHTFEWKYLSLLFKVILIFCVFMFHSSALAVLKHAIN